MRRSSASGGSPGTSQLPWVGWGGLVSCLAVVWLQGWGRCLLGCSWDDGVAPKLCGMRVPATSLARRNTGLAMVRLAAQVRLLLPWLPGWRGRGELERGMEREKIRKGEGIEQKGRDSVCACGGEHQDERLQSQRNEKAVRGKVTEGRK